MTSAGKAQRITSKGQVTVPQEIRRLTGLLPHTEVEWVMEGRRPFLRRVKGTNSRGRRLIRALRESKVKRGMTTDEIMELTRGE
jgi:bifunctional DNA-binding transcriptional regulator/antitoxin component of YhaV-PrlF toxin-antitoxin module